MRQPSSHRCAIFPLTRLALTDLGIATAYWLDFGLSFVDNGMSAVRWRFLLAFQCLPAILLVLGIKLLPDSPRYLVSAGRTTEALEVLEHLRGGASPAVEIEMAEMIEASKGSKPSSPLQFAKILLGRGNNGGVTEQRLGRRAWLCVWLQIMASWTGITVSQFVSHILQGRLLNSCGSQAVTAYSPVLLRQAGYSAIKQNGLAGGLNTIGIVGTIISAQIVDRAGRRKCLMFGALGLCIVNAVAGGLYEASRAHPGKASHIAPAAVTMLVCSLTDASTTLD